MRKRKRERGSLSAGGASSISIPIPPAAGRPLALACVCGLTLAALLPGAALADGMTLELAKEAVQSETTQINYTASTETAGFITIAVNKADVPCGSLPEADSGTRLAEPVFEAEGPSEMYSGSMSFTPLEPGPYIICGWATGFGPGETSTGGPDFAAASLPVEVRLPHISLTLSLANGIAAGRPFTLNLMAASEVARELILVGGPATPEGCRASSASATASPLIKAIITGPPQLHTASVSALPAGSRWVFCAWALVPGTLNPQATTSMVVNVPRSPRSRPRSKPKRRRNGRGAGEARSCGTEKLGDVITATIQASGVSCGQAHGVVHAVEYTRGYVPVSPYFTYSRSYSVSTPAGRFACRREPFGLAGSEHNIRCKRANVSVSWYTIHD